MALLASCYDFSILPVIETATGSPCSYEDVVVSGKNFSESPSTGGVFVRVSSAVMPLDVISWSDVEVRASIPKDLGGASGEIFVRTSEGASNALPITIRNPAITGHTENPCAGGTVTLMGECLGGGSGALSIVDTESLSQLTIGASDADSVDVVVGARVSTLMLMASVDVDGVNYDSSDYELVLIGTREPFDWKLGWTLHRDAAGTRHIIFQDETGLLAHTYEVGDGCWIWPSDVVVLDSDDGHASFSFGDEYLHVTYGSSVDSECFYKRYSTSTGEWSEEKLISNVECRGTPAITRGPNGEILAYWMWGSTKLVFYDEIAGSWGETKVIRWPGCVGSEVYPMDGGCKAWFPTIRFGTDGTLFALFGPGGYVEPSRVKFSRSFDGGELWTVPYEFGSGIPIGDLEVDPENILHVAYAEYLETGMTYRIVYEKSYDGGLRWVPERIFDETESGASMWVGMEMSQEGGSIAVHYVEKVLDESTGLYENGGWFYYLWRSGDGWSEDHYPLQLRCASGGLDPLQIMGIGNDGSIGYATIVDPLLFGRFLVEAEIDPGLVSGDMAFVPGGCMRMGSEWEWGGSDERPVHDIKLSPFYIDRHEVTNAQYRDCVEAGACTPPTSTSSRGNPDYYALMDDYPVIYVTWSQAAAYCAWAGKRLPTEAEWEKAAAGASGRHYPWGDCPALVEEGSCCIDCSIANAYLMNWGEGIPTCPPGEPGDCNCDVPCIGDTAAVGSHPGSASLVGAHDMAGNVSEWVWDYYSPDYYSVSREADPQGPGEGTTKVVRGGSYFEHSTEIRCANRAYHNPDSASDVLGFRCATSALD